MSDETMTEVMEQATEAPPSIPDPAVQPTLNVEEVAVILNISRGGAYEAVRSGDLPSLRLGRRVLVPTAALRTLLGMDAAAQRSIEIPIRA